MNRETLITQHESKLLSFAAEKFQLDLDQTSAFDAYEGCANLVYACKRKDEPVILRISFTQERTLDQIKAEVHFINHLAENGVRAARPIPSMDGSFVREFDLDGLPLHFVCFERGVGMRVPDNGYRYREDAPIEEYFQNWGAILGQMHALSKTYQSLSDQVIRPEWFNLHAQRLDIDAAIPSELSVTHERICSLLDEIRSLPRDEAGFGLIHGDFNDGNFTVDYSNGNITVFDFDDSCYFWFAYELAAAWEGGIGRVMFRPLENRKAFMSHYMDQVFEGYNRENHLPKEWVERIPLFIRLIQVEEFLHFVRYYDDPDEETRAHLNYLITCIDQELPYMGFFDPVFSPQHPFLLP